MRVDLVVAVAALVGCGRFDFDRGASDGGAVCTSAQLDTDPVNCGACGHDCLGGQCAGGTCQPVVLATNQSSPFGIAVDDRTVYWANNVLPGAFASCAKAGCNDAPTLLTSSQPLPADVFVRGTELFLAEYGDPFDSPMVDSAILHCTADDCAATLTTVTLAAPGDAVAVVADAANVYFTVDADGAVDTVPVAGGSPMPFAADVAYGPWYGLAIDATNVYFTSRNDGVYRCPLLGGGACTQLAATTSGDYAWSLAIDSTTVYWTEEMSGGVRSCPLSGCPQAGATVIASGQGTPRGIVVDDTYVYWLDSGPGTVMRCPLTGCLGVPETLAANQGGLWKIAIDATALYWTASSDNTIVKLAKP